MLRLSRLLLLSLSLLALTGYAAELVVINDKLTGARNVEVEGTLYDVNFVDGTCAAVYNGCDEDADFAFQPSAGAASEALLSQVFLDVPQGAFDSTPSLTLGCPGTPFFKTCIVVTPFAPGSVPFFTSQDAFNQDGSSPDFVASNTHGPDFFSSDSEVLAVWSLSSVVPEPSALLVIMVGVLSLAYLRNRQDRRRIGAQ